jgi:hypothetical protein
MKRTIIGIALLFVSMISNISILISTSLLASNLTEWYSDKGRFMTALSEYGLLVPYILTYIFIVISILILTKEYFSKENK